MIAIDGACYCVTWLSSFGLSSNAMVAYHLVGIRCTKSHNAVGVNWKNGSTTDTGCRYLVNMVFGEFGHVHNLTTPL